MRIIHMHTKNKLAMAMAIIMLLSFTTAFAYAEYDSYNSGYVDSDMPEFHYDEYSNYEAFGTYSLIQPFGNCVGACTLCPYCGECLDCGKCSDCFVIKTTPYYEWGYKATINICNDGCNTPGICFMCDNPVWGCITCSQGHYGRHQYVYLGGTATGPVTWEIICHGIFARDEITIIHNPDVSTPQGLVEALVIEVRDGYTICRNRIITLEVTRDGLTVTVLIILRACCISCDSFCLGCEGCFNCVVDSCECDSGFCVYCCPYCFTVIFHPNEGAFASQAVNKTQRRNIILYCTDGTTRLTYAQAFIVNDSLVNPEMAIPVRPGYTFGGWFNSLAEANNIASQDGRVLYTHEVTDCNMRTLWARWTRNRTPERRPDDTTVIEPPEAPLASFTSDHIWYVRGFPEGDFRPGNSITRAEMSMILFRLLDSPNKYLPRTNNFSDVHAGWYAQAVSYLASRNIVTGYPDGTFRPNAPITRAELTAAMSRFFELHETDDIHFTDVSDSHWAIAYINNAASRGWVIGFEDNTFRPNNPTTRAEAVTMLNRILVRSPNPESVRATLYPYLDYYFDMEALFIDITSSHWAYYDIMEAAVEHLFTLDVNGLEIWSEVSIPWLNFNSSNSNY